MGICLYFESFVEMFSFQEEARKHFNCPILEGMELENQGGMGTELNHWEKRLLEVSADIRNGGACGNVLPLPLFQVYGGTYWSLENAHVSNLTEIYHKQY